MNVLRSTNTLPLISRLPLVSRSAVRLYATDKPDLSNSHVVGGYKATLNNPNASEEAKVRL